MNSMKIALSLMSALFAFTVLGVKVELKGNNWTAVAKSYTAASKNGYINSVKVDGKEFLAQSKVPGGSYLCGKTLPPLGEFKKVSDNTLSCSCSMGKVTFVFTDKDITCTYEKSGDAKACFYFIIGNKVTTVLANGAEMLEVPAKAYASSFKWLQGETSLEFKTTKAGIWGPWKGYQVWQMKPAPGKKQTLTIIPGKVLDTSKFNQLAQTVGGQTANFNYSALNASGQIPLCMIGDSITWAGYGDAWRKSLLKRMPNLAFIGTHTARYGYSHGGEGGDSTGRVLNRIKYLPDCPYYSLLIGTNNNSVKKPEQIEPRAEATAKDIIKIVNALLQKKGTQKVFLSSILPCYTKNPLRDQCNSETNKILRAKFDSAFPKDKVVWIEYEQPLRKVKGWEKKIKLHPTPEGYDLISDIMVATICKALNVKPCQKTVKPASTGVRVVNLMGANNQTVCSIIPGWYTLSFKVDSVTGKEPVVILQGKSSTKRFRFNLTVPVKAAGQKVTKNFFTQYERYNYSSDVFVLKTKNCKVSDVLLEKTRPSGKASTYGNGSYIDAKSPVNGGELLEYVK
jgi:hypothetical protein